MPETEFGLEVLVDEAYLLNFEPNLAKLITEAEDTSLEDFLEITLEEIKNSIRGMALDPALIPTGSSDDFKLVHAYKTVEMLNLRAVKEQGDRFQTRATEYRDRYLTAISQISFDYDMDENDVITTEEQDTKGGFSLKR